MNRKVLVGVICVVSSFTVGARAQDAAPEAMPAATDGARVHDGFFFQLGAGLGHFSSTASIAGFEAKFSGMTVPTSILLGGSVTNNLVIGGGLMLDFASSTYEVNGVKSALQPDSQYVVALGGFGDYYLDPAGGPHVQLFVGWGGLETKFQGSVGGSDPTGLMLGLGGGYDMYISDEWSFGGLVRITYGKTSLNSVSYPIFEPTLVANLTYH